MSHRRTHTEDKSDYREAEGEGGDVHHKLFQFVSQTRIQLQGAHG